VRVYLNKEVKNNLISLNLRKMTRKLLRMLLGWPCLIFFLKKKDLIFK
jgi:hypothetical protein